MPIITVDDKFQTKYQYELVEKIGENFDKEFQAELTPPEMLELGVFGGKYLNDCQSEFPKEWYENARLSEKKDKNSNYFLVDASQSLGEWQRKGWIHPQDPRGWFQWYCRYYFGRRTVSEDQRQIKRWKAFRRHAGAVKKYCELYNFQCRKKQRQALLHWAYDSRQY